VQAFFGTLTRKDSRHDDFTYVETGVHQGSMPTLLERVSSGRARQFFAPGDWNVEDQPYSDVAAEYNRRVVVPMANTLQRNTVSKRSVVQVCQSGIGGRLHVVNVTPRHDEICDKRCRGDVVTTLVTRRRRRKMGERDPAATI